MNEFLPNYIDGEFTSSFSGNVIDNYNPSKNTIYSQIPDSKEQEIKAAVSAAKRALPQWSAVSVKERAFLLNSIADEIESRKHELAMMEMRDCGKTFETALNGDIDRSIKNFRFFAQQIQLDMMESFQGIAGLNYSQRTPVGVCGLIMPWNLPLYLLSWKVAPALACGNTVVCKPSELSPRTATELAYIMQKLNVPKGVFNLVHGTGINAGQSLVTHPDVNAISFTGGTKTGSVIGAMAGKGIKKLSLELGGKNPGIIYADCEFDLMINDLTKACFSNQGQICLTLERLFVERPLIKRLINAWIKKLELTLKYGDPETSNFGSLISQEHRAKIEFYIQLAQKEGGKIVFGGKRPQLSRPFDQGAFIEPTVITNLAYNSRCATEEVFGPFVTIHPFDNEEDLLKMTNHLNYGLACSLWTSNINKAHMIAQKISTGMIWVNGWCVRDLRVPFGGVGTSGIGREGGVHSLEFYSHLKNICINIRDSGKKNKKAAYSSFYLE